MPHTNRAPAPLSQSGGWWTSAVDGPDSSLGLASSSLPMSGFFAGWIAVGVLSALVLGRRGHDRKTMVALGAGLGPLMLLVASDTVRRREAQARPLVIELGVDHGGGVDVLVLVQDRPEGVRSVLASVAALQEELRTLTLGRAVAYEWLEGDVDNGVVGTASAALVEARDLLPVEGAELALHPGTPEMVADRFHSRPGRTLVLFAIEEAPSDVTSRIDG